MSTDEDVVSASRVKAAIAAAETSPRGDDPKSQPKRKAVPIVAAKPPFKTPHLRPVPAVRGVKPGTAADEPGAAAAKPGTAAAKPKAAGKPSGLNMGFLSNLNAVIGGGRPPPGAERQRVATVRQA